ncbi:MAG: bifunctional metallophosphatase/5'-nucleotidase, partial [Erysipelotrichaceae bacterium]|nr:bifunctional metallophosphatase/5'-nucleotidase [Erysipelotrichaceae bacterium]
PILVDAGDFTNGTSYVSVSQGQSAVELMNETGYDIVGIGNHDFDFGYDKMKSNLDQASFTVLCSNVFKDGKTIFDSEVIVQSGDLKIGFFELLTPETKTKVTPSAVKDLTFTETEELYKTAQKEADLLHQSCDVVICISHLGVDEESKGSRSIDVIDNTKGIDAMIDAHSHTVMSEVRNGEILQSTGTAFEKIGVLVIDSKTGEISGELEETEKITPDPVVKAKAQETEKQVDASLSKKLASLSFELNGKKADVRTGETNLGDLTADALKWEAEKEFGSRLDTDCLIGLAGGGGIRGSMPAGNVTLKSVQDVFPFVNKVTVVFVSGSQLLEALEAATFSTPEAAGAFPQVSGICFEVDTAKPYRQGAQYPDSTYFAPA